MVSFVGEVTQLVLNKPINASPSLSCIVSWESSLLRIDHFISYFIHIIHFYLCVLM